jgi:hypothetical protein
MRVYWCGSASTTGVTDFTAGQLARVNSMIPLTEGAGIHARFNASTHWQPIDEYPYPLHVISALLPKGKCLFLKKGG